MAETGLYCNHSC